MSLATEEPTAEDRAPKIRGYIDERFVWVVEWHDVEGKFHTDFFCTSRTAEAHWGTGVSYVHTWSNPEEGVRDFLSHLPLHNFKVYTR